jgi:tyrosyl-tRNA synthetase
MFAKVMSIPDATMWKYYELLTEENVEALKKGHPMEAKKKLGAILVERFHGQSAAAPAREAFERVFSKGETPEDVEDFQMKGREMDVVELLMSSGLAASKNEARRLVEQGGVQLDGKKIEVGAKIKIASPAVLKVGKRKFKKLIPA